MTTAVTTLASLVLARMEHYGDRTFVVFENGDAWSFADLHDRAVAAAGQLRLAGLTPGERLGIVADEPSEFIDAFLGAQFAGVVPVPLARSGRIGSASWASLVRRRVAAFGLSAIAVSQADLGDTDDVDVDLALDPDRGPIGARFLSVDGADRRRVFSEDHGELPAFVQPSSGTTGDPRGIVISHRAVLANLDAMARAWDLGPADVVVSWLPLFHDMGLIGVFLNSLHAGMTLHLSKTSSFVRRPAAWIDTIAATGATMTCAPPSALDIAMRAFDRKSRSDVSLHRLRTIATGAEVVPADVVGRFAERFGALGLPGDAIKPTYGLAEATLCVTMATSLQRSSRGYVSCGHPIAGVDVRIDDDGEVLVRSTSLMDGYLDDPEETAEVLQDGWLRTGDVGELTDAGLVVHGRRKDMINRGGARVAPSEFEFVIAAAASVPVSRTAVFGHSSVRGEIVVALVEGAKSARSALVLKVRRALADAGLPADVVKVVPYGAIPRTTSGKVRRSAARQLFETELADDMTSARATEGMRVHP